MYGYFFPFQLIHFVWELPQPHDRAHYDLDGNIYTMTLLVIMLMHIVTQ